jgi:hypothetical protein
MTNRIVLSALAVSLLCLVACAPEGAKPADDDPAPALVETGIGTSPSGDLQASVCSPAPESCGIWVADTKSEAELRHAAAPRQPDAQVWALPGGLSCAALNAAAPAAVANRGGGAFVLYPVR